MSQKQVPKIRGSIIVALHTINRDMSKTIELTLHG